MSWCVMLKTKQCLLRAAQSYVCLANCTQIAMMPIKKLLTYTPSENRHYTQNIDNCKNYSAMCVLEICSTHWEVTDCYNFEMCVLWKHFKWSS